MPSAAGRGGGGSASPRAGEGSPPEHRWIEAAEPPRKGQPLEGAEPKAQAGQHPRREGAQELGDGAGDVEVALGRGQPVDARGHRRADRAQGALLSGREPWRAPSAGGGGSADPARQHPEVEREQRQEAVDEEVQQVVEDLFVDQEEGEGAERGGGLAGGEDQQQRPVADDVGLRDQADPGDHHHVGEGERQPEVLLGVRRPVVVAEPFADVGDHVEDAARHGDEEDADHGEADGEQAQVEDDESLCARTLHGRRRAL